MVVLKVPLRNQLLLLTLKMFFNVNIFFAQIVKETNIRFTMLTLAVTLHLLKYQDFRV